MLKKYCKIMILFTVLFIISWTNLLVSANYGELTDDFRFNYKGEAVPTRSTYSLLKKVSNKEIGTELGSISNFYVGETKVFIADSLKNQIVILNKNLDLLKVLDNTYYDNIFSTPEGVWETPDGRLYVANKGKNNILIFNDQYELINTLIKPQNMVGTTAFAPSKIAVDAANRIYIVVQGSSEGIIELSQEGKFIRYFGTNETKINLIDYFWRMISTEQQKKTLGIITAPPFNNITIANGFYYTTASNPDALENVKKFNSKGIDILLREGYFPIVGNLETGYKQQPTSFTSISVNNYGLMAILDSTNGHVYIYDNKGYLLSVTGGIGEGKSDLLRPMDVRWLGDQLIISDTSSKSLLIYEPTDFGSTIMNAHSAQMEGKYKESFGFWQKVLKYDSNYERAYVGMANYYYYEEEDFIKAMEYFKLGNDRVGYGIAYTSQRDLYLREHFYIILVPIILLIGIVFYTEYRYIKKSGD